MSVNLDEVYGVINEVKLSIEGIKVRQEERHVENTKKIDSLFDKTEGYSSVKDSVGRHEKWIWFIVSAILLLAIKAVASGVG